MAEKPWPDGKDVLYLCKVEAAFKILGSSSAGNAGLLRTGEQTVLVDAGFSARRLTTLLAEEGVDAGELDAVFLTHEHTDHAMGLRGLSKRADLPVFANRDTAQAVQAKLPRRVNWQLFGTGNPFTFRDLRIHPFSIPHDAYDPVGFFFEWGGDDLFSPPHSLAWVTDLGYAPELVREKISKASILVIEANHDAGMLERDPRRPWSLKQRIRGRHGHLSNGSTLELLRSIPDPQWKEIYLAHLSKDCNDVELVRDVFAELPGNGSEFSTFVIDPASAEAVPT